MSKQRDALKMALLALEIAPLDHNSVKSTFFEKRHYAIIALREALAEPEPWTPDDMAYRPGGLPMDAEQAPVAWMCPHDPERETAFSWRSGMCESSGCGHQRIPLYTAPPARKPLTDEEIDNLELPPNGCTMRELVRVVERAHGIGD